MVRWLRCSSVGCEVWLSWRFGVRVDCEGSVRFEYRVLLDYVVVPRGR